MLVGYIVWKERAHSFENSIMEQPIDAPQDVAIKKVLGGTHSLLVEIISVFLLCVCYWFVRKIIFYWSPYAVHEHSEISG